MKTRNTLVAIALATLAISAKAQRTPSHPMDINTITAKQWWDAFQRWQPGRPLSGTNPIDEEFYVSRVKPRQRINEAQGDYIVNQNLDRRRKLLMWTPLDDPSTTWKAFPRYCFEGDNFSLWSYVDMHGNWSAPWIRVSAGFSDVAAKNGVSAGCLLSIPYALDIFAKYPWMNDYSQVLIGLSETDSNGRFIWSEKLIRFMKYYGVNGLGVNSEFRSDPETIRRLMDFFHDCHVQAEKIGWKFEVYWYGLTNYAGEISFQNSLNSQNSGILGSKGWRNTDALFLNYGWTGQLLDASQKFAQRYGLDPYDIYASFDIQKSGMVKDAWKSLSRLNTSIGLWGAHSQNLLHQSATDNGSADIAIQNAYQRKLELTFSGGNRNPAATPEIGNGEPLANEALKKFHGLAALLTAKSAINTMPFVSRFNLGNGQKFRNEGQTTFDHKWYNLNTQDLMPTWRWWITDANDQATPETVGNMVQADFTFADAYFGGSCLRLHGSTPYSRVKLFKTMLDATPQSTLSIVYKKTDKQAATHAHLFVALKGTTTQYIEKEITAQTDKVGQWTSFETTLADMGITQDCKVAMIGLRLTNTPKDYNMLVGEVALRDPKLHFAPPTPKVEDVRILRGKHNTFDFKARYTMTTATPTTEKVYNEDVDTWYYEVFCQPEGMPQQLLTATTSWATYVVDAPIMATTEGRKVRIGVRAVAPDGRTKSDIGWSEPKEVPYNAPSYEVKVNKPVVKPGETFTIKMLDPLAKPIADWRIKRADNGEEVARANNTHEITTKLATEGLYDLHLTYPDGKENVVRGMVQITPLATGAVPHIDEIAVDKAKVDAGQHLTYTFRGNKGEGTMSRALIINDPYMLNIPAYVQEGKTYSYALWFKPSNFAHDKQGTNLINKNTIHDRWPHNNWGDLWVTIRPAWKGHKANEVSFNTMGWTAHDDPNPQMMSTGFQITPGVWHHLVVTQQDNHQQMFINGKLVAETDFEQSTRRENNPLPEINRARSAEIYIGGGGVYKAGFNGLIDEVQVWNKALNAQEVIEAMRGYDADRVPANLKAYYTFEEINKDGTFTNFGNFRKDYDTRGILVQMVGSGGEDTSKAKYKSFRPSNNALGYPGIKGSLPITTTATWTLTGATIVSDGEAATVSYAAEGTYGATLKLENYWGTDEQTKAQMVTVGNVTNGINTAESTSELEVLPQPFAESVTLKFAQAGLYTLEVVAADGTLLQSTPLQARAGDVANVAIKAKAGVYVVRVTKDGKPCKAIKVAKP